MYYDIVYCQQKYRGMERTLSPIQVIGSKRVKEIQGILETYYLFLECTEEVSIGGMERLISICAKFRNYGIPCEIIVYEEKPLENAFGYPIEFLGIDIVHDMCESLISDEVNINIRHLLNKNGLCRREEDVKVIVPWQEHGDIEWKPCYVYKLLY